MRPAWALLLVAALPPVAHADEWPTDALDVRTTLDDALSDLTTPAAVPAGRSKAATGSVDVILLDHGTPADEPLPAGAALDLAIGPPTTRLDHGDPAADGQVLPPQLAPVVRLLSGEGPERRLVCTGTLVNWDGEVGALTAAHCLYEDGAVREQIGSAMRTTIYVDGVGQIDPASMARIAPSFSQCPGLFYEDCIGRGGDDLAFIPLMVGTTWNVCSAAPLDLDVVAYGFGLDLDHLPKVLLKGALTVSPPFGGLWAGRSESAQQVNAGDSGGPVITRADHDQLAQAVPNVCFVIAARRFDESLLQPIWSFTSQFAPR